MVSPLSGVILIITLLTKSHEPLSKGCWEVWAVAGEGARGNRPSPQREVRGALVPEVEGLGP